MSASAFALQVIRQVMEHEATCREVEAVVGERDGLDQSDPEVDVEPPLADFSFATSIICGDASIPCTSPGATLEHRGDREGAGAASHMPLVYPGLANSPRSTSSGLVDVAGVRAKASMFEMRLMHSRRGLAWL